MRRPVFIPIIFALLSMIASLFYIHRYGIDSVDDERESDWYAGFSYMLVHEGKYQDCLPQSDSLACDSPLPKRAYRLPGYPLLLAGVMIVAPGHEIETMLLFQAVLVGLITFLTIHLTYRLIPDTRFVLFAGFLIVFARNVTYWSAFLRNETLYTFVLMIFVWAFAVGRYKSAGALAGLTLLIRTGLIFTLPLILLLIPRRRIAGFLFCIGLVITPWIVRNLVVLDTPVMSTNGGMTLRAGHNAESYATGRYTNPPDMPDWGDFVDLSETEQDRALTRAAVEYITSQDVGTIVKATARKLHLIVNPEGYLALAVWSIVAILEWRKRHESEAASDLAHSSIVLGSSD